jgi:hypothetical protein
MNKHEKFEARHAQDKNIIVGVIVVLVILGGLMMWLSTKAPNSGQPVGSNSSSTVPVGATSSVSSQGSSTTPLPADKTIGLAKFLTAQGIKMYGAAWCTHCQDQKKAFGDAFQYVTYVECPDNVKLCLAKGVQGYPTWLKPNGEKLEGFVELPKLAEWAGFKY